MNAQFGKNQKLRFRCNGLGLKKINRTLFNSIINKI